MPKSRKSAWADARKIMTAIFYVLRTGMPWRDLLDRYGPYVRRRIIGCNRWSRRGIWEEDLLDKLASKSRDSLYLIDSTIVIDVRAASGANGGSKIRRSASAEAGGKTKIHAVVDSKGRPLNFTVTGGQVHDSQVVEEVF